MNRILIFSLLIMNFGWAGPTKVGNGDDGADLEGFELVNDGKLIDSKKAALDLVKKLNTNGILGLGSLINEIQNNKIYLTKKDVSSKKLEELGAFHSGLEGQVYARTFSRAYSPTRFFPVSLKLTNEQLVALHIHEALHRALPENVREDEKIVSKLTLAITAPDQTADGIYEETKATIPDLFVAKNRVEVDLRGDSALVRPGYLQFGYSKFLNSKRKFSQNINLPIDHSYNFESKFFPFGSRLNTLGFKIKTSYIITKRDENYFGPLEFSFRNLFFTERGYDFELFCGLNFMSSSNSKVIDSVYGYSHFLIGLEAHKLNDLYKLNFGFLFNTGKDFERILNGIYTYYQLGPKAEVYGEFVYPFDKMEMSLEGKIISPIKIRAVQNSQVLIDKGSDQYFMATPTIKYSIDKDLKVLLIGNYLFNSNKNQSEDYTRDLFGNALGQWRITLGLNSSFN